MRTRPRNCGCPPGHALALQITEPVGRAEAERLALLVLHTVDFVLRPGHEVAVPNATRKEPAGWSPRGWTVYRRQIP